jgi:endoribonuclease Dicer
MKHDIVGIPMPTRTLARRVASLIACRILHKTGELDDNLQPIGKEGFRAIEPDWEFFELDKADEKVSSDENEPRPGTTKRRQYYYKRIASVFSNCRPTTQTKAYLYHITMILQCPIPEEQNTRGRKIYPPEEAVQSFGILTTKKIPCISAFPIFTRSGEVKVSLQLIERDVFLNETQLAKINNFINYTFTNVLRLRKYLMLFDPEAVENSFFVVPVTKESGRIEVDWNFLIAIENSSSIVPSYVSDEERKDKPFDYNKFKDAVVMPWYRNQDQPQYFYVAEICYKLSPESDFPGESYKTFHEYYFKKYNIQIQNKSQPLLDVDHTSARLNFLTPRYVNRKGVALPTSSEETKRAKRENLEQKQILVPELCTVHPFPASLWRAAVCLPCVLYRINALLLADEIRMEVSVDLGLGTLEIKDENFEWPMLDFGWTLADVLKKTREAKVSVEEGAKIEEITDEVDKELEAIEGNKIDESNDEKVQKSANDKLEEIDEKAKWLDIGTWSNEMAKNFANGLNGGILPNNLELCSTNKIRYGSPTSWEGACVPRSANSTRPNLPNIYASDSDDFDSDEDNDDAPDYEEDDAHGLKIEFKNDHLAEAVETEEEMRRRQKKMEFLEETIAIQKYYEMMKNKTSGFDFIDEDNFTELEDKIAIHEMNFEKSIAESKKLIKSSGVLVKQDEKIPLKIRQSVKHDNEESNGKEVNFTDLVPYIDRNEIAHFLENESPLTLDDLYEINEIYKNRHPNECFEVVGSGDIFDNFADSDQLTIKENNTKIVQLQIKNDLEKFAKPKQENLEEKITRIMNPVELSLVCDNRQFSFDYQPDLNHHPGPSPSIILQALTMSNANDGINLERLETIGDSFLKYSITTYLYCTYENVNEGKLSYLRSKQVSNLNLYRLGRRKILGESMIATKFEPHDNWLPPCYFVPKELEQALIDAKVKLIYFINLIEN